VTSVVVVTTELVFGEWSFTRSSCFGDLGRGAAIRRGDVAQTVRELHHRRHAVLDRCALFLQQWNLLQHACEIDLGLQGLRPRRLLGDVKAAFGTRHAVRALIEEVVSAQAMAEIVKAPWLARNRHPIPDGTLINQNLNRTQVALEVSGALDRTSNLTSPIRALLII